MSELKDRVYFIDTTALPETELLELRKILDQVCFGVISRFNKERQFIGFHAYWDRPEEFVTAVKIPDKCTVTDVSETSAKVFYHYRGDYNPRDFGMTPKVKDK